MADPDDIPATVAAKSGARPRADPSALPRGTTIGRYVVIDKVGEGGMGAVYSCYDAALHRRVALKLVRSPGRVDQDRLLAEARTMAQLAHPAIMTVHDVGEFETQVFLAMELVDGATLRRWQAKQTAWQRIVEIYAIVADALAYAHDRGVIHRDFKPDNVIVDAGDRPRVTDFGLAKVDPDADPSPASSLITKHTISGTGAGTPGYMSPEQQKGEPTDASTDQYAFCVSLFEALYGGLPPDHDVGERTDLPRELVAAITRGLADKPAQRWPSMRELATVLAPAKHSARWPWLAGAAVVLAAGAISFALWRGAAGSSCDGPNAIDSAWGPRQRDAIRAGFAAGATGISPDPTFATLDKWSDHWREVAVGSCRATETSGQSQQLGDLRTGCLARKLDEVEAFIRVVTKPDRAVAVQAGRASLPELGECSDASGLLGEPALPADPQKRATAARLRGLLDDGWALFLVSQFDASTKILRPLLAQAERLGYPPLIGQINRALGQIDYARGIDIDAAETELYAAIAAQPWRHDESIASTWVELMWIVGYLRHQPTEGLAFAPLVQVAVDRSGNRQLAASLVYKLGVMHQELKQYDQAEALFERARSEAEAMHDVDGMTTLLAAEVQLAALRGDRDKELGLVQRTIAMTDRLGDDSRDDHAMILLQMGQDLVRLGKLDDGVAVLRRGVTVAGDPADLPRTVAALHMAIGEALRQLGDLANAESEHQTALAVADRALSPTGVLTVEILFNLASVENKRGDDKHAEVAIERALTILHGVQKDGGDVEQYLGETTLLHKLSQIQLGLGDSAAAITTAKQALETGQREQIDSDMYGTVHTDLARSLWANGQRDLARQAMHQAALDYQLAGDTAKQQVSEAWLRDPK